MSLGSLLFMLTAWILVLVLTVWSFWKLMQTPREEKLPPPGTSL
jgi:heme/copper-type cytochrome/quinol oxidase subunit 2